MNNTYEKLNKNNMPKRSWHNWDCNPMKMVWKLKKEDLEDLRKIAIHYRGKEPGSFFYTLKSFSKLQIGGMFYKDEFNRSICELKFLYYGKVEMEAKAEVAIFARLISALLDFSKVVTFDGLMLIEHLVESIDFKYE